MSYSELPLTRYAMSGDLSVAYQTMGDGPINIIAIPGIVSHVEFLHEMPGYTAFLQRLSKFARVITFDKRGQGLSDMISGAPTLEERMDDVRAVLDSVGAQRAALLGFSEGCAMSAMFAASYPERVSHLALFGAFCPLSGAFSGRKPTGDRSGADEILGDRDPDERCNSQQGVRPRRGCEVCQI